jgi:pimeloyl-ACP methyl ester carboxylesterase
MSIQLNYKKLGDSGSTIIILHGLLGALDNWQTIAKQLATTYLVYIIDQRNHGRSPHTKDMSYELLAQDIYDFCQQHHIEKTTIIGHSMGGKVAMLLALQHPSLIEKLIVVDIAPSYYDGGHEAILFAMAEAPLNSTERREDIDKFLEPRIHNFGVRQFIMKNLTRNTNGQFEWKSNFEVLILNYRKLMDFPNMHTQFLGNTYFIKGENSNYINQDNFEACDKYFPNNKLIEIKDAGHWVHADNPTTFLEKIQSLL